MMRAFSFPVSPERSRLRGWLEGTVAGLCELHLLRERQERRVRQALRLLAAGSPTKPAGGGEREGSGGGEPAAEDQLDALPGLMWELEQQLGLLRLYPEKTGGEATETDSWPSSGFYEGPQSTVTSDSPASGFGDSSSSFPSASGSYSRIGYASERPKSVGDMASSKEGARRSKVPRSYSAPYPSSQARCAEPLAPRYPPDPFLYPSPLHAVALQNALIPSRLYEEPGAASAAASQARGYPPGEEADRDAFGPEFEFYAEAASHCHKVESYISRLIRRRSQLARGGKPRTSLAPEPLGPPKGAVARQSSLRKRPAELLPPSVERRQPPATDRAGSSSSSTPSPGGPEGAAAAPACAWTAWDAAAVEAYSPPPSSLKKQAKPHTRPGSVDPYEGAYPSPALPDGEDDDAPRRASPEPASYEPAEAACLMVKAQYIPAQQAPRAQQAHRPAKKKPPAAPLLAKGRAAELSPSRERPRASAPPKKCRFTEEGGAAGRRGSPRSRKAAARSQSENSLLNKAAARHGTAEREEAPPRPARPRRPHAAPHAHVAGGHRRWRSTAEICQEGEAAEARRGRQAGGGAVGYGAYAGSDSECSGEPARRQAAPGCRLDEGLAYADSESSLSESPPPYSSGASSDTDGSGSGGGLVWPQQLSPQLVSASGPGKGAGGQPNVFVKIKASHALKKKIMRFRSGSLKVMTTV